MPKCYVYTRVSTNDQEDALAQQDRVAMAEAQIALLRHPEVTEIVGPIKDKASAFKIPFHKRPNGKLICEMLQRGDIIVFARLDRFVRLGKDFELQFEEWTKKGITIIFADLGVDMSTAAGGLTARMFAAFAQYFSESLSERQKLAWRERHVHGTQFPSGSRILVKKVTRPGMPSLTVVNRQSIVYLRYIVGLRRASYKRDGVPMGWEECGDRLERARVQHGDIEDYRPRMKRHEWCWPGIRQSLKQLMTTELPALNSKHIVAYFRSGLNPFELGQKRDGQPPGYKHAPRKRETLFDHVRKSGLKIAPKKPKRWSWHFDCCQDCGRTDYPHLSRGLCQKCYGKQNGQQTKAG